MRQFKNAELRELAARIRAFMQRAEADGFGSAAVVGDALWLHTRIARMFSRHIDAKRGAFNRPGFDDLPEPMQHAVEAAAHAYDVLVRIGGDNPYDNATATQRLVRAAEIFGAVKIEPAEAVPADADRLRDAIHAVLGCVTDLRRDTFRIRSPLSAESCVEIEAHLTALRPAIDGAVAALHALTPETFQRLGNGWRMRVRSALERIERSLYDALPMKRGDGDGFHPADTTALAAAARPNWDDPYAELSRCQESLWQLRYSRLADATEIEPTAVASEPKGDEPDGDVADPATGFVANPRDPSAYEPISVIKDRWVKRRIGDREIEERDADRWLMNNPEIRWTKPGGHGRRRSIHIADAEAFLEARLAREVCKAPQPLKPRPATARK